MINGKFSQIKLSKDGDLENKGEVVSDFKEDQPCLWFSLLKN